MIKWRFRDKKEALFVPRESQEKYRSSRDKV